MDKEFDYLVYIGRFQPIHNGHLEILRRALAKARRVVVVLGSARRARDIKNPFTDSERGQMIAAALGEEAARVTICPVRDWYDDDKWVADVQHAVQEIAGSHPRIGLIGHLKDHSSYYLRSFPGWSMVHEDNHAGLNATDLRRCLFGRDSDARWGQLAASVPPSVLAFLGEFRHSPHYADLAHELAAVESSVAAWASAPYPPIFVTVDAVVRCNGHVLMIRRGASPGRGQWALPGGFLEQKESLRDGSIRELLEETGLAVTPEALRKSVAGSAVFDHPGRSERGRTITHGFFFDLDGRELPAATGADDADEARWVPIDAICGMETSLFEDHIHIIDRFMKILSGPGAKR